MDYLIWAVPVMLWVAVTTHAATQSTPCYCWIASISCNPRQRGMSWLVVGFWGCAAMWLISLAGDIGLARNPSVAEGMQWLPLICAIIAFIGMCYFGHATSMFGW